MTIEATVNGKPAMKQMMEALAGQMNDVRWRIFQYAQNGDSVFLEGVDDFVNPEGRRVVLPYAGVLMFRGALISQWRDYFDRGLFDRSKAGEPLPDYLKVLTHGWRQGEEKLTFQLSRTLIFPEMQGMSMTWTPLVKTTYNHHYFEKSGWGHITPGFGVDLSKNNWTLNVSLKRQLGMNGIRDLTYYEVSLNASNLLK